MNKRHIVVGDTFEQAHSWADRVAALMPEGDEVYGTVGFPIVSSPDVEVYLVGERLYAAEYWDTWMDKLSAAGKTMFTNDSIVLMELLREDEDE